MILSINKRRFILVGSVVVLALLPALLIAAEGRAPKSGVDNANQETVDMFSAMEKGQIAVKLIPKDSTQSRIFIENKTDKPLSVKLPETFAAVPVLAQRSRRRRGIPAEPQPPAVTAAATNPWAAAWEA